MTLRPKIWFVIPVVFVVTGFVISGFLPIQITVILPGPKNTLTVLMGTSLYRVSYITVHSIGAPHY